MLIIEPERGVRDLSPRVSLHALPLVPIEVIAQTNCSSALTPGYLIQALSASKVGIRHLRYR